MGYCFCGGAFRLDRGDRGGGCFRFDAGLVDGMVFRFVLRDRPVRIADNAALAPDLKNDFVVDLSHFSIQG